MTTLKQVDKEDLEEGFFYIHEYGRFRTVGKLINGLYQTHSGAYDIEIQMGKFFGPIELEGE